MKTFKQPLTAKEEAAYLKLLQTGEGAERADAKEMLIKAIDSFDAGKGKLSTYASRCIDNELLMFLRAKKKTSREVSLYEPIGTDREGNEINLLDIIEQDQIDVIDRMEAEDKLSRLSGLIHDKLNDREREIITLRYGLTSEYEVTQREIGRKLGISRSYVSRIEKRALEKLREAFEAL